MRFVAAAVAAVYFSTNVALAYSMERNVWVERRRHVEKNRAGASAPLLLASLPKTSSPLAMFQTLSPASKTTSALSDELTKTLPAGFAQKHADLFTALHTTHGTIRKVWLPTKNLGNRVVIHIQDVHQNEDAQRHIGGVVGSLVLAGQADLVALEGAFAPIDVTAYHEFEDREVIAQAANCLLRGNLITGPVHTLMTTKAALPLFVGVDDKAHYEANVEAYRRSVPRVAEYKKVIVDRKRELGRVKKKIFSKALQVFDARVEAYKEERGSLADYVAALDPEIGVGQTGLLAQAFQAEKALDFEKVEQDRKELIEALVKKLSQPQLDQLIQESAAYRLGEVRYGEFYRYLQTLCRSARVDLGGFPHMNAYIRYVMLSDRIDGEKLMEAMAAREKERYGTLAKTADEKKLVAMSTTLHLTDRLLNFALTPLEWAEYDAGGLVAGAALSKELDLTSFESFYREAHARDSDLARNLVASMTEGKVTRAVLVAGGYHTEGVSERLREAGVTVVTFTPRIEKVDTAKGSDYLSVFTQEKTPLEKLFAGEKLFVSQLVAPDHIIKGLGPSLVVAGQALNGASRAVLRASWKLFGVDPKRIEVHVANGRATVKRWGGNVRSAVQITVQRTAEGQFTFKETVAAAGVVLLLAMTLFPIAQMALAGLVTAFLSALVSVPGLSLFTAAPAVLAPGFPVVTSVVHTFFIGFSGTSVSTVTVNSLAQVVTVALGLTLLTTLFTRGPPVRGVPVAGNDSSARIDPRIKGKALFIKGAVFVAAMAALYFSSIAVAGAATVEVVGNGFPWGVTLATVSGLVLPVFAITLFLKKPRWLRTLLLSGSIFMAVLAIPLAYMYDKYDYWVAEGYDSQWVENPSTPGTAPLDLKEFPWIRHFQTLGKNSNVVSAFGVMGGVKNIPSKLRYAQEAKNTVKPHIPVSAIPYIAQIRQIPKAYIEWIQISAQKHKIPSEIMVASLLHSPLSSYSLFIGLDMIGKRITALAGVTRYVKGVLPSGVLQFEIDPKLSDIVGGVVLGAQNSMGVYQLRPVTVRQFLTHLDGRNLFEMTDREIARALLDPRVNIETFAAIYRAVIDDVEKRRLKAVAGQDPLSDRDELFRGAKSETKYYSLWIPSKSDFAQLPSREAMEESDWILSIYHPLYGLKFVPDLTDMTFSLLSGVLDETPKQPIIDVADTEEDLAKLVQLERHADPYIADAAKRTVERLLAGPRGNLLREFREDVSSTQNVLPHAPSAIGLPAPVAGFLTEAMPVSESRAAEDPMPANNASPAGTEDPLETEFLLRYYAMRERWVPFNGLKQFERKEFVEDYLLLEREVYLVDRHWVGRFLERNDFSKISFFEMRDQLREAVRRAPPETFRDVKSASVPSLLSPDWRGGFKKLLLWLLVGAAWMVGRSYRRSTRLRAHVDKLKILRFLRVSMAHSPTKSVAVWGYRPDVSAGLCILATLDSIRPKILYGNPRDLLSENPEHDAVQHGLLVVNLPDLKNVNKGYDLFFRNLRKMVMDNGVVHFWIPANLSFDLEANREEINTALQKNGFMAAGKFRKTVFGFDLVVVKFDETYMRFVNGIQGTIAAMPKVEIEELSTGLLDAIKKRGSATDEESPNNILFLLSGGRFARSGALLDIAALLTMNFVFGWNMALLVPLFALAHLFFERHGNWQGYVKSFRTHLFFLLPYVALSLPGFPEAVSALMGAVAAIFHYAYDQYVIGKSDARWVARAAEGDRGAALLLYWPQATPLTNIDGRRSGMETRGASDALRRAGQSRRWFSPYALGARSAFSDHLSEHPKAVLGQGAVKTYMGLMGGALGIDVPSEATVPVHIEAVSHEADLLRAVALAKKTEAFNKTNTESPIFITFTPQGEMTPDRVRKALGAAQVSPSIYFVQNTQGAVTLEMFESEFAMALAHFDVQREKMFLIVSHPPTLVDLLTRFSLDSARELPLGLRRDLVLALLNAFLVLDLNAVRSTLDASMRAAELAGTSA